MIPKSTDGKQRVLSLSYGKDSMACLGACELLGWPLDRIVTAEVWATDEIEADLPPMVDFKAKADRIIFERYGIQVEHYYAIKDGEKMTFEKQFYSRRTKGAHVGSLLGWPMVKGCEAQKQLKIAAIKRAGAAAKGCVQYIGIAFDEPQRFHNLDGVTRLSPLVEAEWTEADAWKWAEENGLLSPLYDHSKRGGCFFCPCQSTGQLRLLRKMYPDLCGMMLKWDEDLMNDAQTSNKHGGRLKQYSPHGQTLHDYEERFKLEDDGFIYPGEKWQWNMINAELNYRLF